MLVEPAGAELEGLRRRRLLGRAGAVSQQRLDRRPAGRAADARSGRGLPRMGADDAGPAHRHRAGARAADHRREARDQRRDGRLPADAFPDRRDRVGGDAARGIPAARHDLEHRRLRRAGHHQRTHSPRDRRQRHLQRARQQRPRHRGDRPRHTPRADQPDGRAPGRHRPHDARPSRQVLLLHRRGRGGHDLAAALGHARHSGRRHLGRHRDGRDGAAPDHERVDHRPEGDPGNVRRRDARQPAPLLDLRRQLRDRDPEAVARAHPGRGLDQARHRRVRLRARAHPPRRMGRCRQGRGGARPRRERLHRARLAGLAAGGRGGRAGGRLRRHHPAVDGAQDQGGDRGDRRVRGLRAAEERDPRCAGRSQRAGCS